MRRSVAVGLAASLAAAGAAVVGGRRARAVFASVDTHRDYWRERAESDGDLLYVALGDSTAQGVGSVDPDHGYVGRLAEDLARVRHQSVRIVNLGVSGARVADLVRDQLPALRALLAAGPAPALVTVTIGANDTGRTDADAFEADMRTVLDALPAGTLVADIPYFRGRRRGRSAQEFSEVIRRLVAEHDDLVQVDLWVVTRGLGLREYAPDFFHPSALGYDRYYRAFREHLPPVAR